MSQSRDHISPHTRVEHIHMSSTHQPRYCHNTVYKAYNFSLLVAKQKQGSRDFGSVDHGRSECAALGYRGIGLCYTLLHNVTQNVTHCYTMLHSVTQFYTQCCTKIYITLGYRGVEQTKPRSNPRPRTDQHSTGGPWPFQPASQLTNQPINHSKFQ